MVVVTVETDCHLGLEMVVVTVVMDCHLRPVSKVHKDQTQKGMFRLVFRTPCPSSSSHSNNKQMCHLEPLFLAA